MKIFDRILDVLYPNTCCFCGRINRENLCEACKKEVVYIEEPRCKRCGKPIGQMETEFCYDCQGKTFAYEQGKSLWIHRGRVPWSVYQFKYHNRRIYGRFYARELYRLYGRCLVQWGADVLIPIPLHWRRRRKRGYNQAELVARELGKLSGIPVNAKLVRRTRDTKPQKELNDKERRKNLQGAFYVSRPLGEYRHIVLVDDIYTTGSTIDTVAMELKKAGAQKVWFLTISIGQGF